MSTLLKREKGVGEKESKKKMGGGEDGHTKHVRISGRVKRGRDEGGTPRENLQWPTVVDFPSRLDVLNSFTTIVGQLSCSWRQTRHA